MKRQMFAVWLWLGCQLVQAAVKTPLKTSQVEWGVALHNPIERSRTQWQPGEPTLLLGLRHFVEPQLSSGLRFELKHFRPKDWEGASLHILTLSQETNFYRRLYADWRVSAGFEWGILYPTLGNRQIHRRDRRHETEISGGFKLGLDWQAEERCYRLEVAQWRGTKSRKFSGYTFALLAGFSL
ncbi:MAG: hypothetical protein OXT67_11550 [Zetaproteobacteria bacterium]|nr:hypothetical protein [Zetaproteobacteria bacterium]